MSRAIPIQRLIVAGLIVAGLIVAGMIVALAACFSLGANHAFAQDAAVATASPTATAARPPQEVHWNLIELEGFPVGAAPAENQPYIYLQTQGDKVSGSLGCNRLFGSYDLSGTSLQFHSIASTKMACANTSMENETKILEDLKLATNFQITGGVLSLRVDDRVLAKFQPQKQK